MENQNQSILFQVLSLFEFEDTLHCSKTSIILKASYNKNCKLSNVKNYINLFCLSSNNEMEKTVSNFENQAIAVKIKKLKNNKLSEVEILHQINKAKKEKNIDAFYIIPYFYSLLTLNNNLVILVYAMPFIESKTVLDFLPKKSVDYKIKTNKQLNTSDISVSYFDKISIYAYLLLNLIKQLHSCCYVHGDFKPDNILVEKYFDFSLIENNDESNNQNEKKVYGTNIIFEDDCGDKKIPIKLLLCDFENSFYSLDKAFSCYGTLEYSCPESLIQMKNQFHEYNENFAYRDYWAFIVSVYLLLFQEFPFQLCKDNIEKEKCEYFKSFDSKIFQNYEIFCEFFDEKFKLNEKETNYISLLKSELHKFFNMGFNFDYTKRVEFYNQIDENKFILHGKNKYDLIVDIANNNNKVIVVKENSKKPFNLFKLSVNHIVEENIKKLLFD